MVVAAKTKPGSLYRAFTIDILVSTGKIVESRRAVGTELLQVGTFDKHPAEHIRKVPELDVVSPARSP